MPGQENSESHSGWQIARWLGALAVAIAAAVYYLDGVSRHLVCHDSVAGKTSKVVLLCGPPGLTELLPFALVIAVLLAPDLSELGIPGLLSVKRRVMQQENRQEALETKLTRVEQNIEQRVEQTQNFHFGNIMETGREFEEKLTAIHEAVVSVDIAGEDLAEGAPEAEAALQLDDVELEPPPELPDANLTAPVEAAPAEDDGEDKDRHEAALDQEARDADQRESLTLQLLYLVKNLEQYEAISRLRRVNPGERMAALTEEQQERVDRWYDLFEHELGAVKEVRNAVTHNPYAASGAELQEAVRIARRLLRILTRGLGLSPESDAAPGDPA